MPEPAVLRRVVCDGRCVVGVGRSVVYDFDVADTGMRNLALVALTDAGRSVTEVAAVFGVTATNVSMLRGRARPGPRCQTDMRALDPRKHRRRRATRTHFHACAGVPEGTPGLISR